MMDMQDVEGLRDFADRLEGIANEVWNGTGTSKLSDLVQISLESAAYMRETADDLVREWEV